MSWRGGVVPEHAFQAFNGPIPLGLHLDHLCRVRLCCNPAHLEAVTCKENVNRGLLKGHTWSRGEGNGRAKITDAEARQLRDLGDARVFTRRRLGELYGVPEQLVNRIVWRHQWKHLDALEASHA